MPSFVDATEAAPSPAPISTKAAVIGAPVASRRLPAAIAASPPGIARGIRGEASEPAITARLNGAKSRPSALCAWRTARNIAGDVVPVSASATREPRARPGVRSVPRGISVCTRVKAASSSAPAVSDPIVAADRPACSVRLSPKRTAPRPRVSVSAPGRSSPPSPATSSRGSSRGAIAAPASPIGTLTANTTPTPGRC